MHLARQDPFLRVEEIARRVGTTAPYVRTILSESRVLLGELRRAYARDMERRLSEKRAAGGAAGRGASLDAFRSRARPLGPVAFDPAGAGEAERFASEWGMAGGEPFERASCKIASEDGVECLYRLVTSARLRAGLGNGHLDLGPGLFEAGPGARLAGGRTAIEVEEADPKAAASFGLEPGAPVLVVRRAVVAGESVVALEEFLFPAGAVRVMLAGEPSAVLLERKTSATGLDAPDEELMA